MAKAQVTLFVQCLVDALQPQVGEAMLTVLHRLGLSVTYPENQTCCGQPAFNSGYRKEAKAAARRFIEVFQAASVVVCPSGSCVHMVRHHYPLLFADDAKWLPRAQRLAEKTYEFSEYLVDGLGVDDVGANYRGRITYHDSCHLSRGLGVREQPRRLLGKVRGAEFVELNESDRCCGFGGSFAVKYPDISAAMLRDKVGTIIDSGADTVVGCDAGCLLNIQGMLSRRKLPVRTLHIAELLAGAL
jgi:L-lactate dehydrogenase complex protein LldE